MQVLGLLNGLKAKKRVWRPVLEVLAYILLLRHYMSDTGREGFFSMVIESMIFVMPFAIALGVLKDFLESRNKVKGEQSDK